MQRGRRMFPAQKLVPILGLTLLFGCSQEPEEPTPAVSSTDVRAEAWRESQLAAGKETYDVACASCHDQGEGDAPAIGVPGDWTYRSELWVAVLSEHAKAGYLEMPEKGGHGELTDESVTAAVEYMMMETFPELPRD